MEDDWEALDPPPGMVLRLDTTGFSFHLDVSAYLSSLRKAGESSNIDITLIEANSSCLSMKLG